MSEAEQCKVLEGWYSMCVQVLLLFTTCGVLGIKWYREHPRRRWQVFLMDGSKQLFGAGFVHVLNLVSALILHHYISEGTDECNWYWLNIMIDTTFGVFIAYMLLKATVKLFNYESGQYMSEDGEHVEVNEWVKQVAYWCLVLLLMKVVVFFVIIGLHGPLTDLANALLSWRNEEAKLLFVMVVTPAFMNAFQFVVQDSFLKWSGNAIDDTEDFAAAGRAEVVGEPGENSSLLRQREIESGVAKEV